MKKTLTALAITAVLAGCSSTKTVTNSDEPIRNQKLSTSFVSEGIKIETDCAWYKITKTDCSIIAIEAVGTAPTFGNTTNNRKNALTVAEMRAGANVSEFIAKEISTQRVVTTLAKNLEKANDRIKSGKEDGSTVTMTDKEADKTTLRENGNDTAVTMTETIRTSSKAVLKGFSKIKEEVVGDQEVSVTIRWDLNNNRAADQARKMFQ
jgi:heat shock protein HslJ